ncbi:MAG: type II toxin-antitoxin system VapC family toxin [Chloroflexota bacterium]
MMDAPLWFVVDASVGVKLFVDEENSDKTHVLFEQLSADPPARIYVPDLFYIECANILLKYTRRYGRPLEDSRADLVDLGRLFLRVVPTAELMEDALLLAAEQNITAYDACYAVLASRLELPLVTADEPLAKAVGALWIGDLDTRTPS